MDLGFEYKLKNGLKILIEQKDIATKRYNFLVSYHENFVAENPLDPCSQDETWEYVEGTLKGKAWQDDTSKGTCAKPKSTGARFIISHIANRDGFIPNAGAFLMSCKDPHKADDYHHDMNGDYWHEWMTRIALPQLTKPSLIIIDNAPYHTVQANIPNEN